MLWLLYKKIGRWKKEGAENKINLKGAQKNVELCNEAQNRRLNCNPRQQESFVIPKNNTYTGHRLRWLGLTYV